MLSAACLGLAACTSSSTSSMVNTHGKEYFPESIYGKASPLVWNARTRVPRGGGRDQLGKPYMVAGKWYYPKEDKHYKKIGAASWYGGAFHGRLTANGEVYDMTHLTAAHPTMPLPSYARVTNTSNGSSVIVRVNDRGPYAEGRIIDLSQRAAQLLDCANSGTAKVQVEYIGRAPLDGHDDQFLLASYHPGNRVPDPSDGLPTGVMVAMNGSTPRAGVAGPRSGAFPGAMRGSAQPPVAAGAAAPTGSPVELPATGPIAPERPAVGVETAHVQMTLPTMSYAEPGQPAAGSPFAAFEHGEPAAAGVAYVAAGTFASRAEAERLAAALSERGRAMLTPAAEGGRLWYVVDVYPDGRLDVDGLLETAWAHGAPDAITVRD